MFIALFIAAALLFVFAIAVRFAGSTRILNFVEYEKVRDLSALHAWAGHRLLGLACITALLGALAFQWPALAIFWLIAFIVGVLVAVGFLVVGSGKFQGGTR